MMRGLGVQGLVEKHGKLPVYIAPELCAPIGEHAGKFASQIGVQVRTNLYNMNAYRWKNVDSGEKEAIIQNVTVFKCLWLSMSLILLFSLHCFILYVVFYSVLFMLSLSILNSRNKIFFILPHFVGLI